ncbi:MAG: glycosyltransferase family 4 protein [Candidatus Acidiferrum sp.]
MAPNHARELEKRRHKVECWFLEDVLKKPARPRRFEALFFAAVVARRIWKEGEYFDVVNLHAAWGCVYGAWRRTFKMRGAPPYVMTMNGSEERCVQAIRVEHRKGHARNFGWKNRLWHRVYHQTMYDYSIKTAQYGAVVNREAWIYAELKYKRESGLIWYVPNGVEERFFLQREYWDKAACDLLFVGTWLDRKGVYYLTDGFGLAAKKFPRMRLTVAGTSVQEEEVKGVFAPDLRDRVSVIPFVKREEIPELYARHDIFVFPSLVEGMPLTLLEATAIGMPIVTTNTCGMADVVEDDFNGLLVPPASEEKLAEGIERLCQSTELRKRLGLAGQETMRQYTWERVTEKLEEVLTLAARNSRS